MAPQTRAALMLACLLSTAATTAFTQVEQYPARPIRLIVTVPPGGAADLSARIVGQHLSDAFGQSVVIDNRPGGSGIIGADVVAKATPDGYTVLENTITTHGIGLFLFRKLPYDPIRDFAPIVHINTIPLIMVVNRDVPATNVKELIVLAKEKPGEIRFASAGAGSAPHLTGELFKAAAGIDLTHVPYKGSGPAVVDLVANQVQVMFDGAPSLLGQIKSGRLRPLAAASAKRNPLLPELPTFAELGYSGVEAGLWYGLLAPAKTPQSLILKLNTAVNRILALPEVRERFAEQGAVVIGGTPEAFARFMRAEQARWKAVIDQVGLKAD
jgi:tripartite-type tricarboxylate transporter receptor subunit TctC